MVHSRSDRSTADAYTSWAQHPTLYVQGSMFAIPFFWLITVRYLFAFSRFRKIMWPDLSGKRFCISVLKTSIFMKKQSFILWVMIVYLRSVHNSRLGQHIVFCSHIHKNSTSGLWGEIILCIHTWQHYFNFTCKNLCFIP